MKTIRIIALIFFCLIVPHAALADAGVPMLALLWPASWAVLLPVIIIEAWVARRLIGLSWRAALQRTGFANVVSTLIGIPLTWGILCLAEMVFTGGGRAFGLTTIPQKLLAVTVQAPWLIPYESDLDWMIPAAAAVLMIPFCLVSVFLERRAFDRKRTLDPSKVRTWSWRANLLSYGVIEIFILFILCHNSARYSSTVARADFNGDGIEDIVTLRENKIDSHVELNIQLSFKPRVFNEITITNHIVKFNRARIKLISAGSYTAATLGTFVLKHPAIELIIDDHTLFYCWSDKINKFEQISFY